MIKGQRKKQLEQHGKLTDSQLIDRRIQMQQDMNEQFINKVRKGGK